MKKTCHAPHGDEKRPFFWCTRPPKHPPPHRAREGGYVFEWNDNDDPIDRTTAHMIGLTEREQGK